MPKRGKTYRVASEHVKDEEVYSISDAFDLVGKTKRAKFDEMVDVAINLGVDPKHSDQMVRGGVSLPNGTGKEVRVLVFAKGDKETEAKDAGADFVGAEDLIEKIEKENWLEFDKVISTPDMMRVVSRVAKVLGPRGLMPNPKTGTVTIDVAQAIKDVKAGRIDYRVEKTGIVHAVIGRASFTAEALRDNFLSLMESIVKAKPSSAKGTYIRKVAISTTMGPSIKIDPNDVGKMVR